jgi:hypothetical protein
MPNLKSKVEEVLKVLHRTGYEEGKADSAEPCYRVDEALSALHAILKESMPKEESYDGPTGLFSADKYQIEGWNRALSEVNEVLEGLGK